VTVKTFQPKHLIQPFPSNWKLGQAHEKQINNAVREMLEAVREMQDYLINRYE
jgi:hypothetical protein